MKTLILVFLILFGSVAPTHAAFKASGVAVEAALSQIRRQAVATKTFLQGQRVLMVAPTVSATVPLSVIQHLATVVPTLTTLAATPGLVAYAKAQLNDPNYDVAAEFTAMRTTMVSVLDSLISMFPKDVNSRLLYQRINGQGIITIDTFTAAQVAPAVALIDSLIATIE